eukprot:64273-Prymnesium_polylepis.1
MCHVLVHIALGEERHPFVTAEASEAAELRMRVQEQQAVIEQQARQLTVQSRRIDELTEELGAGRAGRRSTVAREVVVEAVARLAPRGRSRVGVGADREGGEHDREESAALLEEHASAV